MSSKFPKSFALVLVLTGCGVGANVGNEAEHSNDGDALQVESAKENPVVEQRTAQPPARELEFLRTYDLEFIHDVLRQKIERIDRLAWEQGMPEGNTVEWRLRPPSVNDNRKLHDFIAKWSSHDIGLYSLQPNQRPGSEIFVMVGVDPANTKLIRSFSLSAHSQCMREGWDARITLFSWRPYQREQVGEETLRFALWRSEEVPEVKYIEWPFEHWYITRQEDTGEPLGEEISVHTKLPKVSLEQIREALTSAESFRDRVRLELEDAKGRILSEIAASRNVGIIRTEFNPRTGIERIESDPPGSFRLSTEQKRGLENRATTSIDERVALFNKDYEKMYAAILQAFPIDKYLAEDSNERLVEP